MADLLSVLAVFLVGYGIGLLHAQEWRKRRKRRERQELIDRIVRESEFRPPLHPSDDRDEWGS